MNCCGKDRVTNFCPVCGKAMNKESSLLSLVRYLGQQLAAAEKRLKEHEKHIAYYAEQAKSLSSDNHWKNKLAEQQKTIVEAAKRRDRWKDWQEALIKLVDGE